MKRVSTTFVALAAVCWGLSGGIGGILMAYGWDALVVSFYRGAVGLLFVFVWYIMSSKSRGLASRQLWFWSVMAGLGVAGNFAFYFVSIEEGSVAVAATLMYCAPVFVYLISFTFNLEKPTLLKWAAIVMVMFGIVLLTGVYEIESSGISTLGIIAGLLSGLSYAVFIFSFNYAAPHGSPQTILVIAFAVLTLILIFPADTYQVLSALSTPDWPLFVLLGVLGAGLSFILYIIGLNHTLPAVASVVAMVEPVTASIFGILVLNESLTGLQYLGMGLILFTATALSLRSETRWGYTLMN